MSLRTFRAQLYGAGAVVVVLARIGFGLVSRGKHRK